VNKTGHLDVLTTGVSQSYPERMKLTIELSREDDGRWIAEIADPDRAGRTAS
jgi:hypothetical protein